MNIKPLLLLVAIAMVGVAVKSQSPSPYYTVSVSWDKYSDTVNGAGFKVKVAPKSGAYGAAGSKTFTVPDIQATNYTFQVEPGTDYKVVVTAYSHFGLESGQSNEATWSSPASLPSPTGLRPVAIVYIPN